MVSEHGFGALVGFHQALFKGSVAIGVVLITLVPFVNDPWPIFGGALIFVLFALALRAALREMQRTEVVLSPEGLRYRHLPDTEVVPWSKMRGVRERYINQRLDILAEDGSVCFTLAYHLQGFAHLHEQVLKQVPLALPTPIRFRRHYAVDALLIGFDLLMLCLAIFVSPRWLAIPLLGTMVFFLHGETRNPYAVEVTPTHLVLSFVFRTLRIPLRDLQLTPTAEIVQGAKLLTLSIEDPNSERAIIIRQVGVDIGVLRATLQAAQQAARRSMGPTTSILALERWSERS